MSKKPESKNPDSKNSEGGKPHYFGHRKRLRERLLKSGGDSLQDYELLEVLLFSAIPRRDVKPLAKRLLEEFKDLWTIVNSRPERLLSLGLNESAVAILLAAGAVALRAQRKKIIKKPLFKNWQSMIDYCRSAMGHEINEQFRVLFLDRKNHLLHEEVIQRGTIDHTPVYPREIVRRAIEVGAGALVVVHNHPSGNTEPSKADMEMTRAIIEACRSLDIVVHDHLIVCRNSITSFKSLGLI